MQHSHSHSALSSDVALTRTAVLFQTFTMQTASKSSVRNSNYEWDQILTETVGFPENTTGQKEEVCVTNWTGPSGLNEMFSLNEMKQNQLLDLTRRKNNLLSKEEHFDSMLCEVSAGH